MTLHDGEYPVDDTLVRELLVGQMPEWSDLPLIRLETSGTVNVAYRLGDDKVVRLPRTADFASGPQREARWLPVFASMVPLEVPEYLALGSPTGRYPSHWSVLRWIEGTNADRSSLYDLEAAATALGEFVVALRQVPTEGAPEGGSYRGFGLARADRSVRRWTAQLPPEIDRSAVMAVWESCLGANEWNGPPRWFHSDLHSANLLARDGELVAVLDWEACTAGDPCADYVAAWWLFDDDSRETFRSATRANDSDWNRGMGWALHMAVAAIPYYTETNPDFAAQARKALRQILHAE